MDAFKLLSRSTKLSGTTKQKKPQYTPSSGQNAQPQLFHERSLTIPSRKRKRGQDALQDSHTSMATIEFFGSGRSDHDREKRKVAQSEEKGGSGPYATTGEDEYCRAALLDRTILTLEERKRILKQHMLKITWLNAPKSSKKGRPKSKDAGKKPNKAKHLLFPNPLQSLHGLESHYGISQKLAANVIDQGFTIATEVQLGALPLLLEDASNTLPETEENVAQKFDNGIDLLTVAPTGSGKTLAFMIPLLNNLKRPKESGNEHRTSCFILAPTKELVAQIVNEGRKLCRNTGIKVTQMRKAMQFDSGEAGDETGEQVENGESENYGSVVKADVIVSTPGILQSAIVDLRNMAALSHVQNLVLDEADVLLDPLFRQQTLEIWNRLTNPALRVSMWSATIGSNIEELATSTIKARRRRLAVENDVTIPEAPLIRLVVGLKDSAVPNVQHKLIYAATEQGKLMGLRQLLHPAANSSESGPALRPPFLVFTQTIERAVALHSELLYDIPAEAGGISRIAVLHSDLSDPARDSVMIRFRKSEIWILITTDLLSRGVDFRGVNGVVNYDIPTSSAAYVHRIGRTGRAGREGGVAVTLYSKEDIPYLKHVANIVTMAQRQKGVESTMQQWLLDAVPNLSKNEKQNLKKRGVECRTARGQQKDPKAARKARISTKAGFVRRAENKRKGAILGSQRRAQLELNSDAGDESEFGGFD